MNLVTFQRTWLRPWALFALEDKALRDELLELFPDGAYVAFAADTYWNRAARPWTITGVCCMRCPETDRADGRRWAM